MGITSGAGYSEVKNPPSSGYPSFADGPPIFANIYGLRMRNGILKVVSARQSATNELPYRRLLKENPHNIFMIYSSFFPVLMESHTPQTPWRHLEPKPGWLVATPEGVGNRNRPGK